MRSARTQKVHMTTSRFAGVAGCEWRLDCKIIARRRVTLCGVCERRARGVVGNGGERIKSVRCVRQSTSLRHLDRLLPGNAAARAFTS